MFFCRPRPGRLAAHSYICTSPARFAATSPAAASTSQPSDSDKLQDSIFTTPESPWDHVFSDIEPVSSPSQRLLTGFNGGSAAAAAAGTAASLSGHKKSHGTHSGLVQRSSGVRRRRASMTAREMSVFDEMFDMIFNAVSAQDKGKSPSAPSSGLARTTGSSPASSSFPGQMPSIGRAGAPLNDLFRTLRRHTSRVRWTTAIDEELDRKKETMELFNKDHDLLQWVTQELFGEAQQWDEEAKWAMAASSSTADARTAHEKAADRAAADPPATTRWPKDGPGNHSIYPHLIAHAMRVFRTTYSNPSLSLAVFNHAARVSIPSYVFGCTAPAYNELIEARWEGWGDLEGVCSALEEMRANGVKIDGRTRIVVERVRKEVGEARFAASGENVGEDGHEDRTKNGNPLARRVWEGLGEAEVMRLVHRIERLALRDRSGKPASSPHEEPWKSAVLRPGEDDGWSFDRWDEKQRITRDGNRSRTVGEWTGLHSSKREMALR